MNKLKQTDIKLLINAKTVFELKAKPAVHKNAEWWELEVISIINGNRKSNLLVNKLGQKRLFRRLDALVRFIRENLQGNYEFTVSII